MSEEQTAVDELKDVEFGETRSRRQWEVMLITSLVLLAAYGLYQGLHRAFGLRLGFVERWKIRRARRTAPRSSSG